METITIDNVEIPEDIVREKPPKKTKFIISLLSPAIIIFAIVILVPIILGIFLSFRLEFDLNNPFGERFTLTNFSQLLGSNNVNSRAFWQYTYQTLFFSVVSLILEFLLGLIFALILNKNFKGRGIARATLLIPWAIPTVASATLFKFEIFNSADQNGLINGLIVLLGGQPIDFYGSGLAPILFNLPVLLPFPPYISEIEITMTMFSAIIIDVWKTTPFITLLILAALQIVPGDLYKAGDIAGASGWQKFRYISWPLVKPGVGIALIFRMMQALRVYDAIAVLNDSSVYSMTYQSVEYWQNSDFGLASAVSIMILLFILLFGFIIIITTRKKKSSPSKSILSKIIDIVFYGIVFYGIRYLIGIFKPKRSKEKIIEENQSEIIESPRKDYLSKEVIRYSNQTFTELVGKTSDIKPISQAKVNWFIWKRRLEKIIFVLLVLFMCFFCALPFIWIFLRSFRDPRLIPGITQTDFELWETLSFGLYPLIITTIFVLILWQVRSRVTAKRLKWISSFLIGVGWFFMLILPYSFNLLQEAAELLTGEPWMFSFRAYEIVFQKEGYFLQALLNSAALAGGTVVVVLIIGSLIAYAIAKFDFHFKSVLNGFIFSMNSLPGLIIIIPFLQWIIALSTLLPIFNIQGSIIGLILPYSAINLPLAIFILIAFFREIPEDLWKAAKVDGASNFQIFRKVILPLTVPGIFTCAILVFIASWNELLFAQVFLQANESNHPIPLAILSFTRNPGSITAPWNTDIALMAATSLATIPLIIVVLLFQKKIVSGLTRGAVKG